ncbi:cytochrome bc1 complex Rieske iron-sulfur subunit [Arsenicicoccus sp. oral taxon 190]|uniref:cytochrome bc1 complex Rieske iron-sulfur subunit n=1 Tax=Arsenicicoccus sp. oral taxon 190 TaxID=1658671 RepID=UPI0020A1B514|nr:Rieske 2Fe-2S domain-containing protein [Arsenicicoccus sp. oral taxon 190]
MTDSTEFGKGAVRLDQGHVVGDGGIPERFQNPGLPPHVHRLADVDPRAAKRAERQVATLFLLSILATLAFVVAYFAFPVSKLVPVPFIGQASPSHLLLGLTLAASLFFIGAGAVHWAKTLMPDTEVVEQRHPLRSSAEEREAFTETLSAGGDAAQINRRPLIKATLGGALGLFAIPLVLPVIGGLGPLPGNALSTTFWDENHWPKGRRPRLMRDPEMLPIKADEVTIGSVFHVLPEGIDKAEHPLDEKGKAAVLLMRLNPEDLKVKKARDWGYQGIVAYSKICTHVGCPVGLYEQQTHHLLCPCHQSTFDVTQDCKVIFGPAHRPLPQLKINVDDEGYLVAESGFAEAVGPSFWERG